MQGSSLCMGLLLALCKMPVKGFKVGAGVGVVGRRILHNVANKQQVDALLSISQGGVVSTRNGSIDGKHQC